MSAVSEWPSVARRNKRGLCGCGAERTTEIQVKAQLRKGRNAKGKMVVEQLGSVSRTVCDSCARRIFGEASELIEAAATPQPLQGGSDD